MPSAAVSTAASPLWFAARATGLVALVLLTGTVVLGIAFDLLLAVLVTSLLRTRVGPRAWRAVHWAGYACWPVALVHGLGTGTDGAARWVLAVTAVCAPAVVPAGAWRLAAGWPAHAGVRVTAAAGCGLAETARVVRYLAGQSAGQCGPCVNGLPAIANALEQVAFGAGDGGRGAHGRALRWLRDLFGLVEGRGACHLPDGVARLAASALRVPPHRHLLPSARTAA